MRIFRLSATIFFLTCFVSIATYAEKQKDTQESLQFVLPPYLNETDMLQWSDPYIKVVKRLTSLELKPEYPGTNRSLLDRLTQSDTGIYLLSVHEAIWAIDKLQAVPIIYWPLEHQVAIISKKTLKNKITPKSCFSFRDELSISYTQAHIWLAKQGITENNFVNHTIGSWDNVLLDVVKGNCHFGVLTKFYLKFKQLWEKDQFNIIKLPSIEGAAVLVVPGKTNKKTVNILRNAFLEATAEKSKEIQTNHPLYLEPKLLTKERYQAFSDNFSPYIKRIDHILSDRENELKIDLY